MKGWYMALLTIVCAVCAARTTASSIVYQKQVVLSVPVHVVYVNLDDRSVRVTVAMAKQGRGGSEAVESIISRTRPAAAVTGTFFDTRSLLPTGDIVIAGSKVHSGCVGPALCIDSNNKAEIIPHKYRSRRADVDYQTVLAGGPTLVWQGKVSLNPRAEGFSDPAIFRMARRTAVGLTSLNKLILVSVNRPISMGRLAKIMVELGAEQALLLDGGTSTAMYAGGRYPASPGRKLTNLLMAYETPDSYHRAIAELAPNVFPDKAGWATAGIPVELPWYQRLADETDSAVSSPVLALNVPAADTLPALVTENGWTVGSE